MKYIPNRICSKFPYRKKIFIDKSNIHGFGIIAKKDIDKGETVFIIKGKIVQHIVTDKKSAQHGSNWIGISRNKWINPDNYGLYLNHSSNPTCGIRGSVTVCALKKIKAGEEITIDYSITEEQELWCMKNIENNATITHVRSIQTLPLKKFKSYLPFVPRYFKKVYLLHHKLYEK
jgi:SET domain-containing protein